MGAELQITTLPSPRWKFPIMAATALPCHTGASMQTLPCFFIILHLIDAAWLKSSKLLHDEISTYRLCLTIPLYHILKQRQSLNLLHRFLHLGKAKSVNTFRITVKVQFIIRILRTGKLNKLTFIELGCCLIRPLYLSGLLELASAQHRICHMPYWKLFGSKILSLYKFVTGTLLWELKIIRIHNFKSILLKL